MTYFYLALAIVFEAGWAIAMKISQGLTRPWPTAATIVMYVFSLVFLALATRKLQIGVTYAVWAGVGAAIIAGAGIVHFKEPVTPLKLVSLGLVILGVIGLNLSGHAAPSPPPGP
jgi:multidrug transporter EmrE-like cation transporter